MKLKLDSRIIEGKKPLTYFDIEEARHFIGRKGYFSDNVTYFANLNDAGIATLGMVNDSDWNYPFMATGEFSGRARYFLPKEWMQEKEPEPVWKPYDLDSWQNDYNMGRIITFRYAAIPNDNTVTVFYHGKQEHSADLNKSAILLGSEWYDFQKLFNEYEIFDNKYSDDDLCRWRPFGYQE